MVGHTQYGRIWLLRILLLAVLGAFLVFRGRREDGVDWWTSRSIGAGLATVALVLIAGTGHAITVEDWGAWAALVDAGHLLVTGAWLGGLVPLALLLRQASHARNDAATVATVEATRRFSSLAGGAVLVLVVTGVLSSLAQVRTVPALVGTPYGRVLLVKIAIVLALLGLGAANRLRLLPRLVRGRGQGWASDVRRLRRSVVAEAALGALVLVAVAALTVTPPARHVSPDWPWSVRLSWEAMKDVPGVRTRVAIGSQLAVLGLIAALLAVVLQARRRVLIVVAGTAAMALGAAVALPPLAIDAYPTTFLRPAVPYTALSVARGHELYRAQCAACHGASGYGDGPAAPGLTPKPADLTARHAADHTVGDMYWWLTHGKAGTSMPGFAGRLAEEDRWDLINFSRALGSAERARTLGPVVDPSPSLVAPDFPYAIATGEPRALRDLRGRVVLLVLCHWPDTTGRLRALASRYAELQRRGAEVLAVPLADDGGGAEDVQADRLPYPIVQDSAQEVAAAYALFRRDLSPDGLLPEPPVPITWSSSWTARATCAAAGSRMARPAGPTRRAFWRRWSASPRNRRPDRPRTSTSIDARSPSSPRSAGPDEGARVVKHGLRLVLATLAAILVLGPDTAWPHASLVRSSPAARATLTRSPERVDVWFNERVEPRFSRVSVLDDQEQAVDAGEMTVAADDARRLSVPVRPLGPGVYTVRFRVLSVDGHVVEGQFKFTIRAVR